MSDFTLIHEDETLLVVNKAAGVPVNLHSNEKRGGSSLTSQLQAKYGGDVLPAHRVDDDVGGLVACARGKVPLDFLSGQFQSKTAGRVYRGFSFVATEDEADRITTLPLLRDERGCLPETFDVNYALAPSTRDRSNARLSQKRGPTRFHSVSGVGIVRTIRLVRGSPGDQSPNAGSSPSGRDRRTGSGGRRSWTAGSEASTVGTETGL